MRRLFLLVVIVLTWPLFARADDAPLSSDEAAKSKQLLDSITPRWGSIALPQANATLNLAHDYYFLDPADSKKVLVDGWGNPKDAAEGVLGMVFRSGTSPLGDGWGAVITYEDTGYVADTDARKTNYDDVLKQLREGEDEDNAERKKENVPTVHLVGWGQPPTYDPGHHALVWARELDFSGHKEHTLNYDVRVLGRRGVLILNMVSSMSQLPVVRDAATDLETRPAFSAGYRYADYKQGVDKRAAYGLAGLVLAGAGLVAVQKIGILGAALLFLKKGIFVVLAAGAAAWAWIKRRFSRPEPPA